MAYYDRGFVDRIRSIKELQRKRFLPLEVIKAILDHDEEVLSRKEIDTLLRLEGRFYEDLHYAPGKDAVSREEARARYGIDAQLLEACIEAGILTPVRRSGRERFEGEDIALLESLRDIKRAGFDDQLIPREVCLSLYVESVDRLAREELKLFSRAVTGMVDTERLPEMAMAGVRLVEQFIVLLRRKLLLRAIQDLRAEAEAEAEPTGTDS